MADSGTSFLQRMRDAKAAAFVAPFVVFMVMLEGIRLFRIENSALPWWQQYPEHWGYPLQVVVCLVLIWFWRKHYPKFSWSGMGWGIGAGVFGILVWLLPPVLHHFTGWGDAVSWLSHFGFQERLEGFDPEVFREDYPGWVTGVVVAMRFLRLVVIVSLVEEIFWRGFLMRWISDSEGDWSKFSLKKCSTKSLWITAGAFALAHAGPDVFVAVLYGALAGWVTIRTGNLWAVVAMHMTANLVLGIFIMSTGWWGLW